MLVGNSVSGNLRGLRSWKWARPNLQPKTHQKMSRYKVLQEDGIAKATIQEAKKYLRIDSSYEDDLISSLLSACIRKVELRRNTCLIAKQVSAEVKAGTEEHLWPFGGGGGLLVPVEQEPIGSGLWRVTYIVNASPEPDAVSDVYKELYLLYHHPEKGATKKRYYL